MAPTLDWYRENLEEFVDGTAWLDMSHLYAPFLERLPKAARILDLGCGAGSATAYFAGKGYPVVPVDGCPELCAYTTARTGCQARCLLFQALDYCEEFDGVWACASLLHVPKSEMGQVYDRIHRALKPGGILYASYKYGDSQRERNGRFFSDYTPEELQAFLEGQEGFTLLKLWQTQDSRPDRAQEQWVNVICRKR